MKHCLICGARISDTNTTGIGCECLSALRMAQRQLFFSNETHRLRYYYSIEMELTQKCFLETFKDTKFRSSFRISFYKSISEASRISKKQMDICKEMISEKYSTYNELLKEIENAKEQYLQMAYSEEVSREAIELCRQEIRNKKI